MEGFRSERRETQEGGRTVITEPGRVIVRDPGGQAFIRHNEVDRFRYGARDIRTQQVGNETRTIVIRPDGTQIITVNDRDGQLLRRIRRDQRGREIIIIDNSYRGPRGYRRLLCRSGAADPPDSAAIATSSRPKARRRTCSTTP